MNESPKTHNKNTNEELIRAIQNGEDRFDEFVKENYGLISQIAYYYSSRSLLEYDDLFNRFTYVAWRCVVSFNFESNKKFSTMFYKACLNEVANITRTKEYRLMTMSCSLHNKVETLKDEEMEYIDLIETTHSFVTYEEFLKEYCTSILEPRLGTLKTQVAIYYLFEDKTLRETTEHFKLRKGRAIRYKEQAKKILKRELSKHWL